MRVKILIPTLALMLLGSGAMAQRDNYEDDLYGAPRKTSLTREQRTERKARREQLYSQYYSEPEPKEYAELVTSYSDALARRVDAYNSTEQRPANYYTLMDEYREILLSKYDPRIYNVIEFNNMMWVEPQDITALFDGSDPASGVRQYSSNYKKIISQPATTKPRSSVTIYVQPYGGYWGSPYYSGWGNPWYRGYGMGWGFSVGFGGGYWGSGYGPWGYDSWGPGYWGSGYWGPSWGWGGHNHHHWGSHHNNHNNGYWPGHGGGSSHGGRPVINGNHYGSDNRGAPSLRPGSSNGRVVNGGDYNRRNNGTNVINYGGGSRPSVSTRPTQGSPRPSVRPSQQGSGTSRPSVTVDRPTREQWESSRPQSRPSAPSYNRPSSTPSYNAPSSRPSSGGSGGGFGSGTRR